MNESKLKKDFQNINKNIVDKVYNIAKDNDITNPEYEPLIKELMGSVDYDYANSLAEFIASLFGVDRCDMLTKSKSVNIVHARELWWNALYFLMGKNYKEIALITTLEDSTWRKVSIGIGINRVSVEMKNNYELQNKWDIIKKMVSVGKHDSSCNDNTGEPIKYKVKVYKPKNVNIEIVEENN